MRNFRFPTFCLLIGFTWFSVTACASDSASADLEGAWEGFIAETPARLTHIGVELTRAKGTWQGSIDLPGAEGLPLSEIRVDGVDLHFELQIGEARVVFNAKYDAEMISGRVVEGEGSYSFDLQKLPDYPQPANQVDAWKQDLDVVRSRFLKYDRSFDPAAKAAFTQAISELEASLPGKSDPEIIVALSRAVALSGNAHTRLYLLRNRTELRRLPVRVHWFSDGLFVVQASYGQRDKLRCRVTSIAGHDPRWLKEQVARLFAGNESWVDYKSPYFMTSPEILYGLRLIDDMENVAVGFDCPEREPSEVDLPPLPLQRKKQPTEEWKALSPGERSDGTDWVNALSVGEPGLPLYLRDSRQHYWFEFLAENNALYLQYNRSQNMAKAESFSDFAKAVEAFVTRDSIDMFILDLRFNTGGNNGIAVDFMKRLVALEEEKMIGRLYVIIGRSTFSAGISHAAFLKQYSDATFVGEPVGDELDTWSEGGNIVLPNSGLTVHFTNGFHGLSDIEYPEFEKYEWSNLNLPNFEPDLLVRASSNDYFSGRDPVLEAILKFDREL